MPAIIALVVAAVVALIVASAIAHVLFSPWLLLMVVAVVAWIRFRPGRTRR